MQPNIDMSLIREAMARRQMGGVAGGNTAPAAAQQSLPGGAMPSGSPNTPSTPAIPQVQGGGAPGAAPQGQARPKPNPSFDDDTKVSAKALMQQLLKYM